MSPELERRTRVGPSPWILPCTSPCRAFPWTTIVSLSRRDPQPFLDHFRGHVIATLKASLGARVRGCNHGKILFRRQPHHDVPHGVGTIMHQRAASSPASPQTNPATGIIPTAGRGVKIAESL